VSAGVALSALVDAAAELAGALAELESGLFASGACPHDVNRTLSIIITRTIDSSTRFMIDLPFNI
jgi:hypothetical protein